MSPRPLRFCMLTTFYPPWSFGGDGIQVQRLSEALAERGHEVTVVHSPDAYRSLGGRPSHSAPEPPGVRVVSIEAGLGALSPLATYLSGRPLLTRGKLRRALEGPFDVLHFHNPSLLGGPALLRMGAGVKVYTLHEQWLICPTHVLWKYQKRVCEKPDCVRCTISHGRPPQPWRRGRLLERSLVGLDALIAPSDTSARLHERFAGLVHIERLDHFLPDPGTVPGPEESPGSDRPPYFLFAGRLELIKGVEGLIDSFRGRAEDLLIAGSGSQEAALRRHAADIPNVRFLGWLGERQLDPIYRNALALVLPTLGHESFPLVMLEAFSRAKPVVARRFGAHGEILARSGAGLTYLTKAELAEALDRLAGDPGLRGELGGLGRREYERRWRPEAHFARYFALLAQRARVRGESELADAAEAAV
jgi:glycosyltransferase involved in cell wall biosynthesis